MHGQYHGSSYPSIALRSVVAPDGRPEALADTAPTFLDRIPELQAMRSVGAESSDRLERAGWAELDGRAQGVANR
jgi:hypothetical protein